MNNHTIDGMDADAMASALSVPRVVLLASVTSTMDEAHRLGAEGAPAGTLVIADEQTAGRGRGGKQWTSGQQHGLWMTLLERPATPSGLDVLSLRLGLHAAPVLELFSAAPLQIKWPNDLYSESRKLAGVLVEARWREQRADWVAIGIGVNIVSPPEISTAIGLLPGTRRSVLALALAPALRAAAAARGPLTASELAEFDRRDFARDRETLSPAVGVASGITSDGALIITGEHGVSHFRAGSLEFAT
ncbi:MAG TPA: biotin--[acetyl-CoA-carboxylase] ligase [Gemmatimonadaceae bacterium]|nr:biotin--[acetyl-CoA-carboxylase] ligase [Gemmatimonadaceae bacterium]